VAPRWRIVETAAGTPADKRRRSTDRGPAPHASGASLVSAGALEMGLRLTRDQVAQLASFLDILTDWNQRFGLVGPGDTSVLVRKHLLDSLVPAGILRSRENVIDIGSGAGLPGVPISIACPDLPVTLVDSRRSRVSFLKEVIRRIGLRNSAARECRIEALASETGIAGQLDAAISRAWTGLPGFLDVCARLLKSGGIAVSMKGPRAGAELARIDPGALGFSAPHETRYTLPWGNEIRNLLVFERL
jgi:16S rRNA (guanine527-N7)-methyltransferase